MQNRFAGQPARVIAVAGELFTRANSRLSGLGGRVNRAGTLIGFSAFQWTVCLLLAALGIVIGFSLISIRNNTVDLNANLRETTRAVGDIRADLVKSADGIDRKIAETNQKLFDLVVEIDDLIAEQKKTHVDEAEPATDANQKQASPPATPPRRAGTRGRSLTVHRRRFGR